MRFASLQALGKIKPLAMGLVCGSTAPTSQSVPCERNIVRGSNTNIPVVNYDAIFEAGHHIDLAVVRMLPVNCLVRVIIVGNRMFDYDVGKAAFVVRI
jgi:hypothetical protein